MAEFKQTTKTYLKTLRKINSHFEGWSDSEIIDLCLTIQIDKRLATGFHGIHHQGGTK